MFDQDEVFIRKSEAARRLGVTIRTLERWERAGLFPRRIQLGPQAVAYRASDLQQFAESRQLAERSKSNPATAPEAA
jgi:predicted DNA-binding transcriptional regulator AlpA